MIHLFPEELEQVKRILKKNIPDREVWVFGSRVNGKIKKYSDLDLVILGSTPFPSLMLSGLEENFSKSNLPFRVDIVDWNSITPPFQKIILQKYEVIQIPA